MESTRRERTMQIPSELEKYLRGLTGRERSALRRSASESLAWQWPCRHDNPLMRSITRDNVRMLRTLRYLFG